MFFNSCQMMYLSPYRVFQDSFECKPCYSPHAKWCSTSIRHFISIIIIFKIYSMIFNTTQAGLSLTVLCYVLKLEFHFETNKPFNSCWKTFNKVKNNVYIRNGLGKPYNNVYIRNWLGKPCNKIAILTHDFQHITDNCQTQSSLIRVENHVKELKYYCDANAIFGSCWKASRKPQKCWTL